MPERTSTRPPPGRRRLSREFIVRHQRARIVDALATETMARGYRTVTVADIVRRAGIARNTFYENFTSKEACFLATQEHAVEGALRRVVEAAAGADGWEDRFVAGLGAFLDYVAAEPALARACVVEALSAGPAARERYEQSLRAFVPLLRAGREHSSRAERLPDTLEETIAGGIFWIVYQRIVRGETERIAALLPDLVDFALTPYVGAGPARRVAARR